MKRILTALLAIILVGASLLSLASCSGGDGEEVPTGMQIAEKNERYTFYVPENWRIQEKIDGVLMAYAPNSDNGTISIYSTTAPEGVGVDEYFQSYSAEYAGYKDFKIVSENPTAKVSFGNFADGRMYEMTYTLGEVGYKSFQCFCIKDGYVYIMTYTAKNAQKSTNSDETFYSSNFSQADYSRQCFKFTTNAVQAAPARTPFADDGTPEGMMLISNTEIVDYKLFVPCGWTIDMQSGYTSAYTSDKASVGVSYTMPNVNSLYEYVAALEKQYGVIYTDFSGLGTADEGGNKKEDSTVPLGNHKGYVYNFTAKYGAREIKCRQVFVVVNNSYVYTITFTAGAETFDLHTAEFDKILAEFKFI